MVGVGCADERNVNRRQTAPQWLATVPNTALLEVALILPMAIPCWNSLNTPLKSPLRSSSVLLGRVKGWSVLNRSPIVGDGAQHCDACDGFDPHNG